MRKKALLSVGAFVVIAGCMWWAVERRAEHIAAEAFVSQITNDLNEIKDQQTMKLCSGRADLAKSTMVHRQTGTSLEQLVKTTNEIEGIGGELKKILIQMALEAYEKPRFSTPENARDAVKDFADRIYGDCMKGGFYSKH